MTWWLWALAGAAVFEALLLAWMRREAARAPEWPGEREGVVA